VYGNVRQPGGFSLQRPTQVLDVLALAGGFTNRAEKRRCRLVRKSASGGQTALMLDIAQIESGQAPNLYVREGDVLNVPESSAKALLAELWDVFRGIFTFTYRLDSTSN
jgi:polysaccharide export outer membrane protein